MRVRPDWRTPQTRSASSAECVLRWREVLWSAFNGLCRSSKLLPRRARCVFCVCICSQYSLLFAWLVIQYYPNSPVLSKRCVKSQTFTLSVSLLKTSHWLNGNFHSKDTHWKWHQLRKWLRKEASWSSMKAETIVRWTEPNAEFSGWALQFSWSTWKFCLFPSFKLPSLSPKLRIRWFFIWDSPNQRWWVHFWLRI